MFTLAKSETVPLTPQLAAEFRDLEASPTERELDPNRIKHLREKADAGLLVSFNWSVAQLGTRRLRMNGQHSSNMLCELNGEFPEGLTAHIDHYQVESTDGLAMLFRQFDDRKSSRSPADVSGAYQGLETDLAAVERLRAKLAIEGYAWYMRHIEGFDVPSGDSQYSLFQRAATHPFVLWMGDLLVKKNQELRKPAIIGAIYGTFIKNETAAKAFWVEVADGGDKYNDQAPSKQLAGWLQSINDPKPGQKQNFKAADLYQGCVFAWNALREQKDIRRINWDKKGGLSEPRE